MDKKLHNKREQEKRSIPAPRVLRRQVLGDVAMLLYFMENRPLDTAERREILAQVSSVIGRIEGDLADDALYLRKAVRSYVVNMSGSQPDVLLGTGIRLLDLNTGRGGFLEVGEMV